ncbi:hypothetical protein F5Y11DRAFT_242737 [Daldinia sp. FL1419]|nr:hypothetical protein F5Y11DRAFT_242737 [Daldinia sp. FL1419]
MLQIRCSMFPCFHGPARSFPSLFYCNYASLFFLLIAFLTYILLLIPSTTKFCSKNSAILFASRCDSFTLVFLISILFSIRFLFLQTCIFFWWLFVAATYHFQFSIQHPHPHPHPFRFHFTVSCVSSLLACGWRTLAGCTERTGTTSLYYPNYTRTDRNP